MSVENKASGRAKEPARTFTQVLVSLRGIEAPDAASTRAERSAAMRAQARAGREAVLAWLREHGANGAYKHVSQPTLFGTFTLECTPEVVSLLRRGPGVASVTRVHDVPLQVLGRRS